MVFPPLNRYLSIDQYPLGVIILSKQFLFIRYLVLETRHHLEKPDVYPRNRKTSFTDVNLMVQRYPPIYVAKLILKMTKRK